MYKMTIVGKVPNNANLYVLLNNMTKKELIDTIRMIKKQDKIKLPISSHNGKALKKQEILSLWNGPLIAGLKKHPHTKNLAIKEVNDDIAASFAHVPFLSIRKNAFNARPANKNPLYTPFNAKKSPFVKSIKPRLTKARLTKARLTKPRTAKRATTARKTTKPATTAARRQMLLENLKKARAARAAKKQVVAVHVPVPVPAKVMTPEEKADAFRAMQLAKRMAVPSSAPQDGILKALLINRNRRQGARKGVQTRRTNQMVKYAASVPLPDDDVFDDFTPSDIAKAVNTPLPDDDEIRDIAEIVADGTRNNAANTIQKAFKAYQAKRGRPKGTTKQHMAEREARVAHMRQQRLRKVFNALRK